MKGTIKLAALREETVTLHGTHRERVKGDEENIEDGERWMHTAFHQLHQQN